MGIFSIFTNLRRGTLFTILFRSFQLIVGLVIVGMYATDLNNARKADKYTDGKWVFAVTCGSLAAVTAVLGSLAACFIQNRAISLLWMWDIIMIVLFTVLSGIFGSYYIGEKTEMEAGISRMKTAVGFDFTALILFFITAVFGWWTWRGQKEQSVHTKRSIEEKMKRGRAGGV